MIADGDSLNTIIATMKSDQANLATQIQNSDSIANKAKID